MLGTALARVLVVPGTMLGTALGVVPGAALAAALRTIPGAAPGHSTGCSSGTRDSERWLGFAQDGERRRGAFDGAA